MKIYQIIGMLAFSLEIGFCQFKVIAVYPTQNEINVSASAIIQIEFSDSINDNFSIDNAVIIRGSQSGIYTSSLINFSPDDKTVYYTPSRKFRVGEVVSVVITDKIKNSSGISLSNPFQWSFTIITEQGSGIFEPKDTLSVGSKPHEIVTGDWNNDGYLDLAVVNEYSNNVTILMNDSTGRFQATDWIIVGSRPESITSADFNNNGTIDLATLNYSSAGISVLFNNGFGTFTNLNSLGSHIGPVSLKSADLDGDGNVDLMHIYQEDKASINWNEGDKNFSPQQSIIINLGEGILPGDFNTDGLMDFIVAQGHLHSITTFSQSNTLLRNFNSTYSIYLSEPSSISTADYNTDGSLDLAVFSEIFDKVYILEGFGNGNFNKIQEVSSTGPGIPADVNGDGFIDIITAGGKVFLNKKNFNFLDYSNFSNGRFLTAGDFDNDGDLDIALVNTSYHRIVILNNVNPPSDFHLLQPENSDTLISYKSTLNFKWQKSLDLENKSVLYNLRVFDNYLDTTFFNIVDSTFALPEYILKPNSNYKWYVCASNGYVETVSLDTFQVFTPGLDNFILHQNYPNPFNSQTFLTFELPVLDKTELIIYNLLGQKVKTLINGNHPSGYTKIIWNGLNDSSKQVSSGIYFCTLSYRGITQIKKCLLVK
ncbi:FG-GAP-like repeat-containing protein [Calditrichota bacterium]